MRKIILDEVDTNILVTDEKLKETLERLSTELEEQSELIIELYRFRFLYNCLLFNEWARTGQYEVYKSRRHDDGELCFDGDYFIVVANLPTGQITNHYPIQHYDSFRCKEYDKMKDKWDGHTSDDVCHRLVQLIKGGK